MTDSDKAPPHADNASVDTTGLRDKVLQGGFFLLRRQGFGMGVRIVGVLGLAALLTPEEYGVFVAPSSLMILIGAIVPIGIPTYLIREEGAASKEDLDLLFTWSLMTGLTVAGLAWIGFLASPSVGWLDREYALAFAGISTAGAFQNAQAAARVDMDRSMRFAERGAIEVIGDTLIYLVAIPLAFAGVGFVAPVLGQVTASVWLGGAMILRSGYQPHLSFSFRRFMVLARSGIGYALYGLSNHLFDATILLVSSAFLGKAGAGQVGLAQRLANRTVVLRVAVEQLSLAAVSKVQGDLTRLRRIQAESTSLHLLTTGVGVSALAYLGPIIVPLLFGDEWQDATPVLAFLCLFQFVSIVFDMHVNTLIVRQKAMVVTLQRLVQTGLTATALMLLVPIYEANGVAVSLLVGVASFVILELAVRRLFIPAHRAYLPFIAGMLPLYLSPFVTGAARLALLLPFVAMLALPNSRRVLSGFRRDISRALGGRR